MTATAPTAPAAVPPTSRGSARGRIRLVIAGSLLTGLVPAAALTLVVPGTGSEAVVTGWALLGGAASRTVWSRESVPTRTAACTR